MTRPPETLAGVDAQVYGLLQHVVAIGRHRRAWQPADVVRVAVEHLPSAYPRALRDAQTRAERAEATARRLRQQLTEATQQLQARPWTPPSTTRHKRVAHLTPLQAQVFGEYAKGKSQQQIATERGLGRSSVTNLVHRAADAIGADSPSHAVSLVLRGVVTVRIQSRRSRAA